MASAAVEALEYHSQRLDATFIPAASDPNYTFDCDEPDYWHFVYDLAAFSTGDELTTAALVGVGTTTAVLSAYAVWLWRRLPVDGRAIAIHQNPSADMT